MPRDTLPLHVRVRIETRQAALERLGYRSYREYLRSPHWCDKRRAYRASDLPQRCMCDEYEVDLHHKTYERIGAEELTDLVPLCRRCHQMIHALERRGDITLDFAGFDSLARSMEYARTRADRNALTKQEWHEERVERHRLKQRERSKARRRRKGQPKREPAAPPTVTDDWRASPPKPTKIPNKAKRLQALAEAWEAEQAARKSQSN